MITLDELTIQAIEAKDFVREKQALAAVEYMEQRKLTETTAVGHFGLQKLAKGTKVKFKAGTKIRTTHPMYRALGYEFNSPRNRTIQVFDVYNGYIDYQKIDRAQVRNPTIVWTGTGGYWFYVDINDVEIL